MGAASDRFPISDATIPRLDDSTSPSSEHTPLSPLKLWCSCPCATTAPVMGIDNKARGVASERPGLATALPPLPFPPGAMTAAKEQRCARRGTLLHFAGELNGPVDGRTAWTAAYPVPSQSPNNNNCSSPSRLREKVLGFFRRSSDTTLPRHTGSLLFPKSPLIPASKKGSDHPLRWEQQDHVVVQLRLPVGRSSDS